MSEGNQIVVCGTVKSFEAAPFVLNVSTSERKMENLSAASPAVNSLSSLWRAWPFPAPHLSLLSYGTQGGPNRKCVCVRERRHQLWSKSNWGTSESNHSISLEGIIQRGTKWKRVYTDKRDGMEGVDDNLLCFQTFSFFSHSLPFPPLPSPLFYFTSPLPLMWPSPAATRICWEKSWSLVLAGNPQHAHCLLTLGRVT